MKHEFLSVFQLSKKAVFEVNYYTLSTNSHPNFTMSATVFNQPKSDYKQCGQCQEEVTKHFLTARRFCEKWNPRHLTDLTEEEYAEMVTDLEALKARYNYIVKDLDETKKPYNPHISFYDVKDMSKLTPKYKVKED